MPYMACSPTMIGGSTVRNPFPRSLSRTNWYSAISVDGDVADPVGEPRAGQPRAPGHVNPAARGTELQVVPRLEAEPRRLAPGPRDHRVFLVHAVRGGRVGQVGDRGQELVPCARRLGLLAQRGLDRGRQLLEPGQLVRSRLALGRLLLLGPQRLGPLGVPAPRGVGRQQPVEVLGRPAPCESGPVTVRILPCRLEVNHGRESSRAPAPASRLRPRRERVRAPRRSRRRPPPGGPSWWPGPSRPGSSRTPPASAA